MKIHARENSLVSTENAEVPVFVNRVGLAELLGVDRMRVFRAYMAGKLPRDAVTRGGSPLFLASRVEQIREQLESK